MCINDKPNIIKLILIMLLMDIVIKVFLEMGNAKLIVMFLFVDMTKEIVLSLVRKQDAT